MEYELNKKYDFSMVDEISEFVANNPKYLISVNEFENYVFIYENENYNELDELRAKRTILLTAFDKWEKAVLRGREEDDKSIMKWYTDILDLVSEAYTNIPERISYYLFDEDKEAFHVKK